MENQELFEQLTKLQRSLQDIDSARKMVDETIEAYNGVSSHIASYSNQLSLVSDRINQLITLIIQNKDTLSSDIDTRVNATLEKAEQTSVRFYENISNILANCAKETRDQILELNTTASNIAGETRQAISQATKAANELQQQSLVALDAATSKLNSVSSDLRINISAEFISFWTKTRTSLMVSTIVLSVLILANIIVSIMH